MLLLHTAALGALRRELIKTIGRDATRRLMLRSGYAAGLADARLARQVRPNADLYEAFAVGPQLHMLEGAVQVTPERFEYDTQTGHYVGVYRWDHSWEADTHVHDFGPQTEPVCWMLTGYASGYTSGFFGQPIYYREVQCEACGQRHCRIEGRPKDAWPDGAELAADYEMDSMLLRLDDLQQQVNTLRAEVETPDDPAGLVGESPAFLEALQLLRLAAKTAVTVLLTGETGVGKERFARALHSLSSRAKGPFVAVNCAALPADLIESELFGVDRGAFTGAHATRLGRFERADGGTLFFDEIGDMPLTAQAKLLRALQEGEIERLGGNETISVDVRVVAATNVDLELAVSQGRFRRDLLYRLNVYPIRIPALRERPDDIEPLARHLIRRFAARHGKHTIGLSDRALAGMRDYAWPGNVRELENLIERGVILVASGSRIDVHHLFPSLPTQDASVVGHDGRLQAMAAADIGVLFDEVQRRGLHLADLEQALLNEAVKRAGGNLTAAARSLGLTRAQLRYRRSRGSDLEHE
ncbi:MAG: sigma-54-dependent Fis family transcriptional regulator [Rhodoferax sp.]